MSSNSNHCPDSLGLELASRVKVAFYSGTGGAERIARCFAEQLAVHGCIVDLERISHGGAHQDSLAACELLVLVTVVHDFNTPHQVQLWLENSDAAPSLRAAVFSVSGGGEAITNRANRQAAIRILEAKGATVIYDDTIPMPCNYFFRIQHPLDAMELEAYPLIVKKRTASILAGEQRRSRPGPVDHLVTWLSRNAWRRGARFGQAIKVAEDCAGCGLCARGCPAGNISMGPETTAHPDDNPTTDTSAAGTAAAVSVKPVFADRCVLCLRCLYACPNQALSPGREKFAVLQDGYALDEIASRHPTPDDWQNLESLAKGWLYAGIRRYLQEARDLLEV
ncbi:MAG: EFR1 family ferrodoxin [Coriobacteriales bacterium]|jgi:ferredoxin/flavodoxin|nr:EFR1 family ferrodoxin [Coriobacteriales bacterium]